MIFIIKRRLYLSFLSSLGLNCETHVKDLVLTGGKKSSTNRLHNPGTHLHNNRNNRGCSGSSAVKSKAGQT